MILVWMILGLALWAVLIGWAISPWLVLAGAVALTLGVCFIPYRGE